MERLLAGAVMFLALGACAPAFAADPPAEDPATQQPPAAQEPATECPPSGSTEPGSTEPGSTEPGSPDAGSPDAGSPDAGSPDAAECPAPRPEREVLSRPGRLSRWAFVLRRAVVRARPDFEAERVARLRLKTQDGTDELVPLLARVIDDSGRRWVRVRLPILPNGTTGWVPQAAVGGFHRVRTWLRIDRRRLRATLVRSRRVVFRARIGVGRPRWPTPRGHFYVRDRLEGFGSGGLYGPLAFGLNARSSVLTDWPGGGFIGVHGTNQPYLLPGRISHGCIRMRNRDILRLGRLMPVGTPVTIR